MCTIARPYCSLGRPDSCFDLATVVASALQPSKRPIHSATHLAFLRLDAPCSPTLCLGCPTINLCTVPVARQCTGTTPLRSAAGRGHVPRSADTDLCAKTAYACWCTCLRCMLHAVMCTTWGFSSHTGSRSGRLTVRLPLEVAQCSAGMLFQHAEVHIHFPDALHMLSNLQLNSRICDAKSHQTEKGKHHV